MLFRSAGFDYGYVYTIAFWGIYPSGEVPLMTSDNSKSGGGLFADFTIHHDTVRDGYAMGAYSNQYVALSEADSYAVRVSAKNAEGFGPASAVVTGTTASYANLPSKPTSVVLGKHYTGDSLSLHYAPPLSDGAGDITKYRIEWDTSTAFSTSSSNYGSDERTIVDEVQELSLYFRGGDTVVARSGTFTLSWAGRKTQPMAWNVDEGVMADEVALLLGVQDVGVQPVKIVRRSYEIGRAHV